MLVDVAVALGFTAWGHPAFALLRKGRLVPDYFFTPPHRTVHPIRGDRFWSRLTLDVGRSVLKNDGAYTIVDNPSDEQVQGADIAYLGGRRYEIDVNERASLIAAGYGAYILSDDTEPEPTDPAGFGEGGFGEGGFGA